MKKSGVLNARLMRELTALGHLDSFVICDAGFPVPPESTVIDLALIDGVPSFRQALHAALNEVVVESALLVDCILEFNTPLDAHICDLLVEQPIEYVSFDEFRTAATKARFFVRTAEMKPCSNILLVSASGVPDVAQRLDVRVTE